jgi:hypothetical protein
MCYAQIDESPGEPSIWNVNGDQYITFACLDVNKAREALGIWCSPHSKNNTQFNKLKMKSQVWADCIWIGHLWLDNKWEAKNMTIIKSLKNLVMATMLHPPPRSNSIPASTLPHAWPLWGWLPHHLPQPLVWFQVLWSLTFRFTLGFVS